MKINLVLSALFLTLVLYACTQKVNDGISESKIPLEEIRESKPDEIIDFDEIPETVLPTIEVPKTNKETAKTYDDFPEKEYGFEKIRESFGNIYDSKKLLKIRKTITNPVQKFRFYQHLYLVTTFEDLKNSKLKEEQNLKKFSDPILIDLSKIILSDYLIKTKNLDVNSFNNQINDFTINEINIHLDSVFSTNSFNTSDAVRGAIIGLPDAGTFIVDINDNIVILERSLVGGSRTWYNFVLLEKDKVTDLDDIFSYLNKTNENILEKEILKFDKTYRGPSHQSGANVKKTKNDSYQVSFRGYSGEDPSCCSSLAIRYETRDFRTIVPNTIKVKIDN